MSTKQTGNARMDFRLPAEAKALIEQAAAISCQNLSDFASSTLLREAREIVEQHRIIRMSQADYDAFVAFLDAPAKPIPAVQELFAKREERLQRIAETRAASAPSTDQAAG